MLFGEKLDFENYFGLIKANIEKGMIVCENQDIRSLKIDGKTVIVLCGNNTNNDAKAHAYINNIFRWSDTRDTIKDLTTYAIYYPNPQPLNDYLKPNYSFDYEELAKVIFSQVLRKDGNKVPAEEISKTLGNITFFGHSVGGFVMNELMHYLGKMLENEGYLAEEISKIYSNIVFIGYSPFKLVEAPIKNIYIAPIYDSAGSTKLVFDNIIKNNEFVASKQDFDMTSLVGLENELYSEFFKVYSAQNANEETVYFSLKDTLISTPNLLYFDGIKEDHNLAGVRVYNSKRSPKTFAGEITTQFLKDTFEFSLNSNRSEFSTNKLFEYSIGMMEHMKQQKQSEPNDNESGGSKKEF